MYRHARNFRPSDYCFISIYVICNLQLYGLPLVRVGFMSNENVTRARSVPTNQSAEAPSRLVFV